jgi:hypothetical protein
MGDFENIVKEKFKFPRTLNINNWKEYIGRNLTHEERILLMDFKAEVHMNKMMMELYEKCEPKKLYVPKLSITDGNCMFDSLNYHKIGNSPDELRQGLAIILYIFGDYKDFLPQIGTTLKETFGLMNEIEIVKCTKKITSAVYEKDEIGDMPDKYMNTKEITEYCKYTYDAMCQDLSSSHSWSRLPTELILMVISIIYRVEIIILNSGTTYEHVINADPENVKQKIYLGHLGESHYVPLDIINESNESEETHPKRLFYNNAQLQFLKWAHEMEDSKIKEFYEKINKIKQQQIENDNLLKNHENNENNENNVTAQRFENIQIPVENNNLEVKFE